MARYSAVESILTSALVDGQAAAAIGLPTSGARPVAGGLARGERRVADGPATVERPPPRVRCLLFLHQAARVVLHAPQRVQGRRRRHGGLMSTGRQVGGRGGAGAAGEDRPGGKEDEDEQDDESSLPLHYCVYYLQVFC